MEENTSEKPIFAPRTMKTDLLTILIIVLLLIVIVTSLFIYRGIKTDGARCLADPLVYGAKQLAKANNAGLICSCGFNKVNGASFSFTENGTFRTPRGGVFGS